MRAKMQILNLILIGNLLFPSSALMPAQANEFSSGLLMAVQSASQMTDQFTQAYFQNKQNQINQQSLNASLENMRVKPLPDRYFPNTCQKLPVQGPNPKDILPYCTPYLNASQLQQITSTIRANEKLYSDALLKGQSNQANPLSAAGPVSGIQCLEENGKILQAQLADRANELNNLITDLEKQNEIFKRQSEDELDEIARLRAELDGQNARAKPNNTTLDTEALFRQEPSCQVALRKDLFLAKSGSKMGLKGILQQSETNLAAAEKVLREKESLKTQITSRAQSFQKLIRSKGLDAFINGDVQKSASLNTPGLSQFGPIATIVANKRDELDAKIKEIRALISSTVRKNNLPAPNIPPMGPIFQREIADQIKVYEQTVKDAHLSGCLITRTGGGISSLLGALKQSGYEKEKTASLDYYRRQLLQIDGNNTLSLKEKIAQIEQLERTNNTRYRNKSSLGEFYLFFTDGRRLKLTDLLKQTVNDCNTIQTKVTRLNQATTVDQDAQLVNKYLNELMNLERNVASDVSVEIENRLIHCQGIAYEKSADAPSSGASSCNAQKLDPAGPHFCVAQSSDCATHVQRCRKYASDIVAAKEAQLNAKAENFNSIQDAYRARQNEILERIVAQFKQQKDLIGAAFPGVKTEVPESLLINLPAKELVPMFQVGLVGVGRDGNLKDFLGELKTQVRKIRAAMDKQALEVKATIDNYSREMATNYTREAEKWKKLEEDCGKQIETQRQQALAQFQEQQKQQEKTRKDIGNFCKNLLRFRTGPGCAEEAGRLAGEAEALAQFLYPGVAGQLERYQDVCAQINNPPDQEEEESVVDESSGRHILMQLCDGEDRGMVDALSSYAQSQMDKIEFAINQSIFHDFEEEESSDLERTREERLAYLYERSPQSSGRESASEAEEVSVQDITRYMNGGSSPLNNHERKIKHTTEGQLVYTIRRLANALNSDADLKDGKACEAVRTAAGSLERQSVTERGQGTTTSTSFISEEEEKRRIDRDASASVRKLRQYTKDILRLQKELRRKVRNGATIAQQSGEKVFTSCSPQYNNGRGSTWDAINQGLQGIQDGGRGVFR